MRKTRKNNQSELTATLMVKEKPEVIAAMDALAEDLGLSRSGIARLAIRKFLKANG